MIDIERYVRLSPRGLAEIKKEEDKLYIVFKRFSTEDGSEIINEPEKQLLELPDLIKYKQELINLIFGIDKIEEEIKERWGI